MSDKTSVELGSRRCRIDVRVERSDSYVSVVIVIDPEYGGRTKTRIQLSPDMAMDLGKILVDASVNDSGWEEKWSGYY